MDKQLRAEIVGEVRKAMTEAFELYGERWVTAEELCKQISCITKSWIRTYGHILPREQVIVTDSDNVPHHTGWCYPLHKILRMMESGQMKGLHM